MVSYCLVSRPHEITIYPRYGKTNHCFFASSSCFPDGSPGTALPQTGREGQCRTKGGSGRITLSYHREVCGADRGGGKTIVSLLPTGTKVSGCGGDFLMRMEDFTGPMAIKTGIGTIFTAIGPVISFRLLVGGDTVSARFISASGSFSAISVHQAISPFS